eukprot:1394282-Amorphochlora_amoeboformis.AAC.2
MEGLLEFRVLGDAKWTPRWVSLQSGMLKVSQVSNSAENIKVDQQIRPFIKAVLTTEDGSQVISDRQGDHGEYIFHSICFSLVLIQALEAQVKRHLNPVINCAMFDHLRPTRSEIQVFSEVRQPSRVPFLHNPQNQTFTYST